MTSEQATLPDGRVQLRADVQYNEQGSGQITLFANHVKIGDSKIEKTTGSVYLHEGVNVGFDDLTPVADSYKMPFTFTAKTHQVTIDYAAGQASGVR